MENWQEKIKDFFVVRKQEDLKVVDWKKQKERDREKEINKIIADKNKRLAEVRYTLKTVGVQELLEKVKRDVWKTGSIHDLLDNNYNKEIIGLELRKIHRTTIDEGGTDISGHEGHLYTKLWVVDSLAVSFSEHSFGLTGPQLLITDTRSLYRSYIEAGDGHDSYHSSGYSKRNNVAVVDDIGMVRKNMENNLLQLCKERILARKLPTDPR